LVEKTSKVANNDDSRSVESPQMPKRRLLSTDNDNDLEMLLKEFAEEKPVEVPKEPVKTEFNFKKRKLNDFQLDLA
jgi:hypothetical protein